MNKAQIKRDLESLGTDSFTSLPIDANQNFRDREGETNGLRIPKSNSTLFKM